MDATCRHHPDRACACYCQFFDTCTKDNCATEGYVPPEPVFRAEKVCIVSEVARALSDAGYGLARVEMDEHGEGTLTLLPTPGDEHLDDCAAWLGHDCDCEGEREERDDG